MPKLTRFVPWKIWLGIPLVLVAMAIPLWATQESFGVVSTIEKGLETGDQIQLLEGVFRLVALNALYGYPRYLGAFFISASAVVTFRGKNLLWMNMAMAIFIAGAINVYNGVVYGSQRISALPLLAIPVLQLLLWSLDYPHVGMWRRMPIMICVLTGFQFLNLMPALEHLSLGRDLTAVYVKQMLVAEGMRHTLNIVMLFCASIFFVVGGLMLQFIHNENRMIQINNLKAENTDILANARIKEQQNRTHRELSHLVHDLKTPLTSIQTLAYVVRLSQREGQEDCLAYLERIEQSVEHMSNMISEILYEDARGMMTTERLLGIVLAQLSVSPYAENIWSDNQIPEVQVHINAIRMARAIINLMENSYHSRSERPLEIILAAQMEGDLVALSVSDNGIGIPEDQQQAIWSRGHSNQGSSGLGLSYVQEVVTQCGGEIRMESQLDVGTTFTILLPRGEVNHE